MPIFDPFMFDPAIFDTPAISPATGPVCMVIDSLGPPTCTLSEEVL